MVFLSKTHCVLGTVPVVLRKTTSPGREQDVRLSWKGEHVSHQLGRSQQSTKNYNLMKEMGARKARPTRLRLENGFKKTGTVPRELTPTPTASRMCTQPTIPKKEEPLDRLFRSGDP